ncbi:MAG: hypothetical protein ACRD1T_19515, partial [Acidimicrobiia bacterium]
MSKHTSSRRFTQAVAAGLCALGVAGVAADFSITPSGSMLFAVTAAARSDLRDWDAHLNRMLRDGELKPRLTRADTLLRGRRHERLTQYHQDVPVFGADVSRQIDNHQTVSIFGRLYRDVDLNTTPRLSAENAQAIVERLAGTPLGPRRRPELVILPRVEEGYTLTYQARVFTSGALMTYFIDAQTGTVAWQFNDLQTQAAIGRGRGVLGDDKKVSTFRMGGTFVTNDHFRPPALLTFDMRGDLAKTVAFLNGELDLGANDFASDTDNQWTDGAAVDAHVY